MSTSSRRTLRLPAFVNRLVIYTAVATVIVAVVGAFFLSGRGDPASVAIKAKIRSYFPSAFSAASTFLYDSKIAFKRGLLRPIRTFRYEKAIARKNLPMLELFLSGGSLRKLVQRREEALLTGNIRHDDDEWGPGKLRFSSGGKSGWGKVEVRLKGDWAGHVADPLKWSLRIKSKSGLRFLGARTFSLQHPRMRNGINSFVLRREAREFGIMAPRASPVRVRINGAEIGIMMFEEHFLKEMVESHKRRESPIVAFNEDYFWEQVREIYDEVRAGRDSYDENPAHYDVKVFSRLGRGRSVNDKQEWHAQAAVSLLRQFSNRNRSAQEVFDVRMMAKYFVLMNVWGGQHALRFHNRRFFYSPIERRLSPVFFDASPSLSEAFHVEFADASLMDVPEFREAVLDFISMYRQRYSDPIFRKDIAAYAGLLADYARIDGLLYGEGNQSRACALWGSDCRIDFDRLLGNLDAFEKGFRRYGVRRQKKEPFRSSPLKHVLAYWVPRADSGSVLEITNITARSLALTSVVAVSSRGRHQKRLSQTLAPSETIALPVRGARYYSKGDYVGLAYRYDNEDRKVSAIKTYAVRSGHPTAKAHGMLFHLPGVTVDQGARRLTFGSASTVTIEEEIVVAKGWAVLVQPGAALHFRKGGLLRVEGDIEVLGTAARHVTITVESYKDELGREFWGGLLVVGGRLGMTHVDVRGVASPAFRNREDIRGLTGCITVYRGAATIQNVTFSGLQCEDSLNVISSTKTIIKDSRFSKSMFDGFDGDFSNVEIRNTDFDSIGNDAVDVSGSTLEISGSRLKLIGDKGLSVGERSTAMIRDISVLDAKIGVAAKDGSRAMVDDSVFEDIGHVAFSVFQKKSEYSSAELLVTNSRVERAGQLYLCEEGSRLVISGNDMPPNQERKSHFLSLKDVIRERFGIKEN